MNTAVTGMSIVAFERSVLAKLDVLVEQIIGAEISMYQGRSILSYQYHLECMYPSFLHPEY